jgi:hypothetical protein
MRRWLRLGVGPLLVLAGLWGCGDAPPARTADSPAGSAPEGDPPGATQEADALDASASPPPVDSVPSAASSVCSSGRTWSAGDQGDPEMNPGRACIACHARPTTPGDEERGPLFAVAGTLYPTLREPDLCSGVNGKSEIMPSVEITDAVGQVLTLEPNRAGNFYFQGSVAFPIRARVLFDGKVREMHTPQSSGDCNGCHTEAGREGAPGRVLLP